MVRLFVQLIEVVLNLAIKNAIPLHSSIPGLISASIAMLRL
jgi:hypothetical protein